MMALMFLCPFIIMIITSVLCTSILFGIIIIFLFAEMSIVCVCVVHCTPICREFIFIIFNDFLNGFFIVLCDGGEFVCFLWN